MPFEEAPMGTTGLETAFAAVYTELVKPGVLPLALVVAEAHRGRGADGPADAGDRRRQPADLVLVDLDAEWEVGEAGYESRSENCCFAGPHAHGQAS